ncbi:MAG: hypothetical protein GF333_04935 [Candidatus Omnitrophica bacterium]|nr:hypothetical protein [Candidatus Omnitrophota bacterium]
MKRPCPLVSGHLYHVFNKSIAGYEIFTTAGEYGRMIDAITYYRQTDPREKFSRFVQRKHRPPRRSVEKEGVAVVAYCLMPTHIHLVLAQRAEDGISLFMNNIANSYARYFNTAHSRRGPLWEGRFKNVRVETDEQLLHLTRYLHLNPVTAGLVERPQDWEYSSYREYLGQGASETHICAKDEYLEILPAQYRRFTEERIDDQRKLARIKHLLYE